MSLLSNLKAERTQYYNLKNTLQQVSVYLLKSSNALEQPANIESYYRINEISGDNNEIKSNKNNIVGYYKFLTSKVIPEIDTKIQAINNAITQEEIRIERERQEQLRREEEARRQALAQQQAQQNNK